MKYSHIIRAMAAEVWAIDPDKLMAIVEFVGLQAQGVKFTAEEIQARIAPQTVAAVARREGAVAVVPVRGVIANRMSMLTDISGGCTAEGLGQALEALGNDDGVKAIVLDSNSPGGTAQGVEELAIVVAAVAARKPVIAQVNGDCASAAYWAVCSSSEIVMTPSSRVGSIGAMSIYDDLAKMMEIDGVNREVIVSAVSPFKGERAGDLALTEEARAHIQSQVDFMGDMFVARVAKAREVGKDAVLSKFGKGRMVFAADAIAAGMADRVGTLNETLARLGASPATSDRQPTGRSFASARESRRLLLPN